MDKVNKLFLWESIKNSKLKRILEYPDPLSKAESYFVKIKISTKGLTGEVWSGILNEPGEDGFFSQAKSLLIVKFKKKSEKP
ncbi:hypothetical protein [uncultured Dubosiella sp.]|uniref:hypothetical protein n=1 Tax=uncultured Dubosiella sp. TaxID=1937011 RepID=UPI0032B2ECAA